MIRPLIFYIIGTIAGSLLVAGCSPKPRMCTTIGCSGSTLMIEFPGQPSGSYTILIKADGKTFRETCEASPAQTMEGPGNTVGFKGGPCAVSVATDAKNVKVTLRDSKGNGTTRAFQPEYKDFRPNGPGCAPVCRRSVIEFQ